MLFLFISKRLVDVLGVLVGPLSSFHEDCSCVLPHWACGHTESDVSERLRLGFEKGSDPFDSLVGLLLAKDDRGLSAHLGRGGLGGSIDVHESRLMNKDGTRANELDLMEFLSDRFTEKQVWTVAELMRLTHQPELYIERVLADFHIAIRKGHIFEQDSYLKPKPQDDVVWENPTYL